jgi:diguanylate cyclase (GGDEF)-like protein/PAS domain S-box-containing protein
LINGSIGLLAGGVLALTGTLALNAYRDLQSARQTARVNALVDKLIEGAAKAAWERGTTMIALGEPRPAPPAVRQKLRESREGSDLLWQEAHALAREVAAHSPIRTDIEQTMERTAQALEALHRVRARVDNDLLQERNDEAVAFEWFDAATRYIGETRHLREHTADAVAQPGETFLYSLTIKQYAWLMSEYTGRERAVIGYYIGRHRPFPAARLDELKAWRGVVRQAAERLTNMMESRHVPASVRNSIASMLQDQEKRFEPSRRAVYAAVGSGNYPLTTDAWMKTATQAVDAALMVIRTASTEVDANLKEVTHLRSQQLVFFLALVVIALTAAAISMTWVRRTANTLYHEKELAETTLHSIGDAVITTDARGIVDYLNPIAETLTGWSIKEAKGRPLREVFRIVNGLTRGPQANPVEKCLQENCIVGLENNTVLISRNGYERVIEDSAAPVHDREGKIVGAVLVFYDVTLMRNSPHLLSHHATHDALTGLINRREFERRLTALVESARAEDKQHVLLYMDLDQFKVVNDTCGHIAGDKLLRQLSFLLMNRIRGSDTVARLGGDEFGVLLDNCPMEPALRIANDLVRLVKEFRFVWQGITFEISVSIGVVPITTESESPVALLSQADSACYAAKDRGRNRIQVYQPDDAELLQRKGEMQWVPRIRRALEEDRFVLYCHTILPLSPQPKGSRYCETLLRMVDEEGKIIPPMAFLPAAERYNLMPAIDRWVIRHALATFGKYRREIAGYTPHCFINLAAASLSDETMFEFIREQIESSGMPAGEICFEVTETTAVANLDLAVTFMDKIRELGCRFALDDFGSGMSSFAYLKNLPVDYLKIDGAFVQNMTINPTDCAMVDAINRVGHVMGIRTVAEFVKDETVLRKLRELGVDFAQGFGIAKPEPMSMYLPGGSGGCCVAAVSPPPKSD